MTDRSELSWATVEAYESDDLADEKCMEKEAAKTKGMWEFFPRHIWDWREEVRTHGQTRSLYSLLNNRQSWFEILCITPEAGEELQFWHESITIYRNQNIWKSPSAMQVVYLDDSGTGCWRYTVEHGPQVAHGQWSFSHLFISKNEYIRSYHRNKQWCNSIHIIMYKQTSWHHHFKLLKIEKWYDS